MAYESANKIIEDGVESFRRFYSVYRGIVVDPNDPENLNRIKVCVPEVNAGSMSWAYPRGQHGSQGDGFKFLAPQMGDIVWVSYEYGDPTKPLWEYHGWSSNQVPELLRGPKRCGIVTPEGTYVVIDDENGDITVHANRDVTIDTTGKVMVNSNTDVYIHAEDSIIFNDGTNQGMVNIKDLTTKLNQLVQELETLRNLFNTHVHSGVTTGPGSSGPTPTQVSNPFTKFIQEDYEDFNIIH